MDIVSHIKRLRQKDLVAISAWSMDQSSINFPPTLCWVGTETFLSYQILTVIGACLCTSVIYHTLTN